MTKVLSVWMKLLTAIVAVILQSFAETTFTSMCVFQKILVTLGPEKMFWSGWPDKRMESCFQTLDSLSNVAQVWWRGTINCMKLLTSIVIVSSESFAEPACPPCVHWDLENSLRWGNRLDDRKSFSNLWNLLATQCKFDDKGTVDMDWNRQLQLLLSLLFSEFCRACSCLNVRIL